MELNLKEASGVRARAGEEGSGWSGGVIQGRQCSPDGRRGTPESLDMWGRLWRSEGLFLGGEGERVPTRAPGGLPGRPGLLGQWALVCVF